MTKSQEIIWVALPWGHTADGRARITAFVSPRLRTDVAKPKLGGFPNFVTWPASVNAMTFAVKAKAQPAEVQTTRLSPPADAGLWGHLFTAETTLRPWEFKDHSQRNLRSFPVELVMTYLSGLYMQIAQLSPDDLPLIGPEDGGDPKGTLAGLVDDLGGVLWSYRIPHGPRGEERFRREGRLGLLMETTGLELDDDEDLHGSAQRFARRRRYGALDDAFASSRVVEPGLNPATFGFSSQAAMDFYQAHRFFDRPENESAYLANPDATKIPPPPEIPTFDFHQALAVFGDYPRLLRRLGLAVDLAIDGDLPSMGEIRIVPTWGPAQPASSFSTDFTPWTSYQLAGDRFLAQPIDPSRMTDGMIALDGASDDFESGGSTSRYGIVQVDPDGAALKTLATAVNLNSQLADKEQERVAFDLSDRTGLAPMRSAGMAVFAKDRAVSIHGELADAAIRDGSPDLNALIHSAEHLVRGFRVDVFDPTLGAGGEWRSLCRRVGRYVVEKAAGGTVEVKEPDGSPIVDEGYIKAASTSSADDAASDLYLHEAMFRWDGWSLVAKRPGRTIVAAPSGGGIHQDEEVGVPEPKLETEFKLLTEFEPVARSLPRLRFGRTYRFRVRAVDLAGNSIDANAPPASHDSGPIFFGRFDPIQPPVLVPRAELTEGESVERMVIRSNYDQTTKSYVSGTGYQEENDRHVVPPKTSVEMAERHGALDDAFGAGGNPAAQYAIAVHEAATLEHTHVVTTPGSPPTYQAVAGSQMVPGRLPPDAPPTAEAQGAYLINTQALFPLAYLPDVIAKGVAFRGLPGTDGVDLRAFTGTWPNRLPLVIRIVESPGTVVDATCAEQLDVDPKPPKWDGAARVLTVYLPKAVVAKVRYSCYPTDLGDLAAWRRWMDGVVDKQLAAEGGHWMISPFRELVLVHAVQQPLCPPSVWLDSSRSLGETFARLDGLTSLSVRSTGQLDLGARWSEPIDSLSEPGPKVIDGFGHVASIRVADDLPEPDPFPVAAPLPDGTLPWPQDGGLPLPFPDIAGLPKPYQVTDPKAPGFLTPHQLLEFARGHIAHEFGDTKHRWVRYRLTGTTRFREYFPTEITSVPEKITRVGDEVLVNVHSSARPDAPRVKYIVPSWRWETDPFDPTSWTTFRRTRIGGGLRVWMDRPWYSSGEGEKLGVVVWRGPGEPNERTGKRVSQFGMDPAWASAVPRGTLTPASFANAVDADVQLGLAENPGGQRVDVVAFEPEYDGTARNLWFCDIDMSPKAATSYYPFVRLALARYQRHSISSDTKLSPVIQTDFHQLAPSRTLTARFTSAKALDVTLYGPAPDGPIRNRVEVTVEHHDGMIPGDLGWKAVPGTSPIHLSDGAPDVSWIPPEIPWGLVPASELHARAVSSESARSKIRRTSVPMIEAAELATRLGIAKDVLGGVKRFPVFVIPGHELWSGVVPVPSDPALGRLRIVVREFEHYRADPEVGRIDTDHLHDPEIDGPFLDRIVYADIVELPSA
jgi:hypothetical protein